MKKEITGRLEVQLLVDTFYSRVREDEFLGVIFNDVIQNRWPDHLLKMYDFWETVLFGVPAYKGSPFPRHANLPVNKLHFTRWLNLFTDTLNELFTGEKAEEAKWRAEKMAEMFLHKIEYHQANPGKLML